MQYDVIVIGGGPGGAAAARALAAGGRSVAIVEDRQWGGTCLNRGCIPTKMLLGAVAPAEMAHAQERLRVLKAEINVDFTALQTRVKRFVNGSSQAVGKGMAGMGISLMQGRGELLGEGRVKVTGADGESVIEGADIILACGSENTAFPGMEPDGDCVLDSTGILELAAVPESLLVIGAGAIGLELGHFYSAMGSKVTIVEGAAHIAPLEDADIADELRKQLKKRGIICVEGVFAKSLATVNGQAQLTMADGRVLTAARALVAVGRKPNTAGLGCEAAGITLNRRGFIETDEHLQACPHVYAVGDVNGRVLLAHAAEHQARFVAARLLGRIGGPYEQGPVPSCYYGLEIMRVGETAASLLAQGKRNVTVSTAPMTLNPIAQSWGTTQGFVKAVWDDGTLAGLAAIGCHVSHLVSVAQMLVQNDCNAERVHELMIAHPTLDEILIAAVTSPQKAAGQAPAV